MIMRESILLQNFFIDAAGAYIQSFITWGDRYRDYEYFFVIELNNVHITRGAFFDNNFERLNLAW